MANKAGILQILFVAGDLPAGVWAAKVTYSDLLFYLDVSITYTKSRLVSQSVLVPWPTDTTNKVFGPYVELKFMDSNWHWDDTNKQP